MFHWHPPQLESFLALKERVTTTPTLAYPDFLIPFTLYTDIVYWIIPRIIIPQMSEYIKYFENGGKTMPFMVKDDDGLDNYNEFGIKLGIS